MTDTEIKAKAAAAAKRIQGEILVFERQSIRDALTMLDDLRGEIIKRMAQTGVSAFDNSTYRQIKASIEHAIDEFQRLLTASVSKQLSFSFDLGSEMVIQPLRFINAPLVGISRTAIQVAAQYSAELIHSLSTAAREAINQTLRRAVLGTLPINEAISAVGSNLDSSLTFKSIARRAETIVRTEVLRINSIAADTRMRASAQSAAAIGWLLAREWDTAGDKRVRDAHGDAHGQLRDVETPFLVDNEELQYPRDPAASPDNTINCRCSALPRLMRLIEFQRRMQEQEAALAA